MTVKRSDIWKQLPANSEWDLVIVGGGITGAGILREAVRGGLRVLLVEAHDFAWGTSSRSSKLVHGGMRYLKQGNFKLTYESVTERERLIACSEDLVKPLPFLATTYRGQKPGRLAFMAGVGIYNAMAGHWQRMRYNRQETLELSPNLDPQQLTGALRYMDARADDCRLVFRQIWEAVAAGATVLNYTRAEKPNRDGSSWRLSLTGADGSQKQVSAPCIVNATGVWVNHLRAKGDAPIRPLRGSHLIFSQERLPSPQALTIIHPRDGRPVYLLPWEGVTVFGTTDIDHRDDIDTEASISREEVDYLMEALGIRFPSLDLDEEDIIATYAGVRPVLSTGQKDPSKESRDHKIWDENGILSITGGKLTTFRHMALELLEKAKAYLPDLKLDPEAPAFDPIATDWQGQHPLTPAISARVPGRYGSLAKAFMAEAKSHELQPIEGGETLWAELRWVARHEMVEHLDDLLLRRVRLGLLLKEGGKSVASTIREICQPSLGWDDQRWEVEWNAYQERIKSHYGLPPKRVEQQS